ALSAGEGVAAQHEQPLYEAVEQSKEAYRELFAAHKEKFRAVAAAIAATWNGTIDDPAARFIRRWRIRPGGPSQDVSAAFPEAQWRPYAVSQPLADGRTLELEFVARKAWFEEFQALDDVTRYVHTSHFSESAHRRFHFAFVGMFAAVLLPIILAGVWM